MLYLQLFVFRLIKSPITHSLVKSRTLIIQATVLVYTVFEKVNRTCIHTLATAGLVVDN